MKLLNVVLILLLGVTAMDAQDQPDHKLNFNTKTNLTLFGADMAVRLLDAHSTRRFMMDPCQCYSEAVLPDAVAGSTRNMYLFSIGMSSAVYGLSYLAHRAGHNRISRIIPMIDIGLTGNSVIHNYTMHSSSRFDAMKPVIGLPVQSR